ncbi:MAG: RNA polymerase sigma factor SigZ [Ignavibacteriae bacterium HGW-Ignavibacteriae-1]|jgi:RNA polymerase sigma-70 factor (ECF subfamily)|nr:MAG: RNA polymerase sigma factor SigZ [Ignavibacteriae bacterium HGW-Ignavibacteriae-1]
MKTIEEIWKEYHSNLLAFIRKRVNDTMAAEDIIQEVFIRIHSQISTLKDESKLKSWLYQITRNAIVDYYRTRKPTSELQEWHEVPETSDEDDIEQEISSCLIPMIHHLPEKYRQAVQLSEIEERAQKEIAEVENISISGAKSRVQRGRALLKTMLHDCCVFDINRNNRLVDYYKKDDCKYC